LVNKEIIGKGKEIEKMYSNTFKNKEHKISKEGLRDFGKHVKAIATDIDGTITDAKRRVSTSAIEALRKVEDSGIPVMLVSGNVLPIVKALQIFIGVTGPLIAENGGLVEYNGKVEKLADKEESIRALEHVISKRPDLPIVKKFTDQWRQTEVAIEETVNVEILRNELVGYDVKVESTGFAIHIMSNKVGKFPALKVACGMLGISTDEVMAFGDSENDLDMISGCGLGVAVGNASEEIKKAAKYVCGKNHGDGVVEVLMEAGLIQLTKG